MPTSRAAAPSRNPSAAAGSSKPSKKAVAPSPAKPKARPPAPTAPEQSSKPPASANAKAKPTSKALAKTAGEEKPRKPKLVRDSFTIPKTEYAVIDALKERAARGGSPAKKSELLRAGIKLLASLDDAAFANAMKQVPTIKTGRPAKG
ncbi:hypothetical protein [Ramlibacter rhizophilus]|uniref:Uncharacterized protein n=1 Tax=Ramlibacter rhizophilus TaxID=1781167 RepID=A0A4Z0BS29_9BURK|nr:hypothetical protein [Ramlibacter rhizophilus]TFZ01641.1 hypothetical protein EZ242_09745 [Ramlibacter rhizophilus]